MSKSCTMSEFKRACAKVPGSFSALDGEMPGVCFPMRMAGQDDKLIPPYIMNKIASSSNPQIQQVIQSLHKPASQSCPSPAFKVLSAAEKEHLWENDIEALHNYLQEEKKMMESKKNN